MTSTNRLSVQVAAAALVTFSVFCFLSSPEAAPKKPEWKGKETPGNIHGLINPSQMGGGVVILLYPSGEIWAYGVNPPGPTNIVVYTKDLNGDNLWYKEDGKQEDPPSPPSASDPALKGEGEITDIKIYTGSNCVQIKLGGQLICVTSP